MSPPDDQIVAGLWNANITANNYGSPEQYYNHIFEQYKLYVQMADQVSARRNLANTFFLTLHTFLLGSFGFFIEKAPSLLSQPPIVIPFAAVLALCVAWWMIVRSYRQLNSGKFKVIGEFEKRLPTSPYWSAEWNALGEGKDPMKYLPLTHVENWVPVIFAGLYIGLAVISQTAG